MPEDTTSLPARRPGTAAVAARGRRVVRRHETDPTLLRPTRAWAVSAGIVGLLGGTLWLLFRESGALLAQDTVGAGPSRAGVDFFVYILATNAGAFAWCLLGWLTFGVGSLVAGSFVMATLVISISTGFEILGDASWPAIGVHAGLELLACAVATAAGMVPAVGTLLARRSDVADGFESGPGWGWRWRTYLALVVRTAPVTAGALGVLVVGALWEAAVAVRFV